jgi:hypothetical protein
MAEVETVNGGEGPGDGPDELCAAYIEPTARLVRWAAPLFIACAVILVPWIVIIGITLPSHRLAANYDVAWAGYDAILLVGLVLTAWCVLHRSHRLPIAAAATGALLVADAWFDVLTASTGWYRTQAVAMSLIAELPLAAVCFWLAVRAQDLAAHRVVLSRGRQQHPDVRTHRAGTRA